MSEIDRVAAAICDANFMQATWEHLDDLAREIYRRRAAAAHGVLANAAQARPGESNLRNALMLLERADRELGVESTPLSSDHPLVLLRKNLQVVASDLESYIPNRSQQ